MPSAYTPAAAKITDMDLEPIYDLPPSKVLTCPVCHKPAEWKKDTFMCPVCFFGRDKRLWSTRRWNRAVKEYEQEESRLRQIRRRYDGTI